MPCHFGLKSLASGLAVVLALAASSAAAEPMVTSGIGLANCAQLAQDIKPDQGLNNTANALMYFWTQGYISAANIHLLDQGVGFVDLGVLGEKTVLSAVFDFCKENPDKKPISAIDLLIRKSPKVEAGDWQRGSIKWSD